MQRSLSFSAILLWLILTAYPLDFAFAESDSAVVAKIDSLIRQGWTDNEVTPSARADDGEFARRASLDIVGHIPPYEELMEFLEDDAPDKRARYVAHLLDQPGYIRHWTNLWGNLLVGRGNNRQGNRAALDRWLRDAFYRNKPYDQFVAELIAAEGNAEENGAVAFLASHLNEGAVPATSITSRLFLGLQVQCTQCHNHPFNDWKQDQFWAMNGFFRATRRQNAGERGQFALVDPPDTNVVFFERRSGLMQATMRSFVDGTRVPMTADAKPREQLAKLVTDPTKPYMAQAIVNRMWGHFFGFGFTRPVDDMGPHNPPSHPELLEFLAVEFQKAGYDLKRLIRWITASESYSLTSRFADGNTTDDPAAGHTPLFSRMYVKPFTAEQLYDSLLIATEADRANRDEAAAENQRRVWLQQFVQTFGTDENDEATTFNGTIPQALVLMNGDLVQNAISGAQGAFLRKLLEAPGGDIRNRGSQKSPRRKLSPKAQAALARNHTRGIPAKIETLFLVALARTPTEAELDALNRVFRNSGSSDPIAGLQDVFWAVLNSNEFILNH